jgi:hypothetical protein
MKHMMTVATLGMLGLLAACGNNPQERTSGGAAAGAATGAGIGALAGPPGVLVGGLVGAGAGATTGAVTSPNQVNLGKPPWTNPQTRVPTPNGPVAPASASASSGPTTSQLNDQSYQRSQGGQSY